MKIRKIFPILIISMFMLACSPSSKSDSAPTGDLSVNPSPPPGNTIIITSALDDGPGSLRQALLDAQPNDIILFDPAIFPPDHPATIFIESELPHIQVDNLTLNASETGVILDGRHITKDWVAGLQIVSSQANTIMGLQIINFSGPAIAISGDSKNNVIGGDRNRGAGPFGQGNMVIQNAVGVDLSSVGCTLNTVTGNLIGTDAGGSEGLGNHRSGVLFWEGTHDNTIGPDNIIAYNIECGVGVSDANSTVNTIMHNSIYNNGETGTCLTQASDTEMVEACQDCTPQPLTVGQPNLIFHNGNLITMDTNQPNAQAIAIQNNFIVAVGADDEVLALAGPDTQIIDLGGLTVTPGFIDSHTHRTTQRDKWNFTSIDESTREAVSLGWTGLVELAVDENQIKEMIAADAAGELHTRIDAYLMVNSFEGDSLGDWYQAYSSGQQFSPYLRIAGLKIFIDYNSGRQLFWTQDDLNQFVCQRQLEGWNVTMKAISIQSHNLALNAYAYAMGDDSNGDYRYRIEHSIAASDEEVAKMADLGIIASIQPSFPAVIWNEQDMRNLADEEGMNNMFRWQDYRNAGVFMIASAYNPPTWVGSSDSDEYFDDSHISAMGLIYRGVCQIGLEDTPPEDWMLPRAFTVNQLLPMMTINGAFATFEEDIKGSLSPGKWADLVILSDNPLIVQANNIKDIKVLTTMVNGKTEYCAPGFSDYCL